MGSSNNSSKTVPTAQEKERLTERYGKLNFENKGKKGYATLMGKKRQFTEQYRTKNFTCYTVAGS